MSALTRSTEVHNNNLSAVEPHVAMQTVCTLHQMCMQEAGMRVIEVGVGHKAKGAQVHALVGEALQSGSLPIWSLRKVCGQHGFDMQVACYMLQNLFTAWRLQNNKLAYKAFSICFTSPK